jgi:hypothetical protein
MSGITKVHSFAPFGVFTSGVQKLSHQISHIGALAYKALFPNPVENITELDERRWSLAKKFGVNSDIIMELVSIGQTVSAADRKVKIALLEKRLSDSELKGLQKFTNSFHKYHLPPIGIVRVKEAVSDLEILRKVRKRSNELSLDPKYFASCPWEVSFLLESHLIFKILNLQNSFDDGKERHKIILQNDCLFISSVKGPFPVKTLMDEFIITSDRSLKDREGNVWNYFDDGLEERDVFIDPAKLQDPVYRENNVPLRVIGQLSVEQMAELRAYMKEQFADDPTIDSKEAIIQFVAQPQVHLKGAFLEGVSSQAGTHTFFRIIDREGYVYSSSLQWLQHEKKDSLFGNPLRTVNAVPVNWDTFESRKHHGCIVTPRPVTQEAAERIIDQLNKARARIIRYNQAGNNCVDLANKVLKETGVDLNVNVYLHQLLWRCFPSLKNLGMPKFIYNPLHALASRISALISCLLPRAGKWIINSIGNGLVSLFFTPIVLALGGARGSPGIETPPEVDVKEDDWKFDATDKLMTTVVVDVGELAVSHSSPFLHWQLSQKATFVTPYTGQPKMHFIPPRDKNLKAEGDRLHSKYSKLYAHSAPMA